uniref:C2H2-type domain-containing protein n=1 Tax=Gadus morhua TaxID=8049 RepID=A0A8C5C7U3_GADMO
MVVDDDEAEDYLWSGGLQKEHERGREEQGWREERRREEEQGWRGESFTAGLGFIAPGLSLSESLPASSAHKLHYRPPLTPDPGRLAPHGCGICRKRFGQEAELQKHAACHRRRRAHECSLCGKSFVSRSKLDVHGYVHTGERPFSCTVCPRRFSHPKTQPGDPDPRRLAPHGCDVCSKRFNQEAELQKHAARHRRRRAHVCSLCGKSFVCRSQLDVHGYVHTGERPFGCTVCPRRFSHPSNLRRHHKLTVSPPDPPLPGDVLGAVHTLRTLRIASGGPGPQSPHAAATASVFVYLCTYLHLNKSYCTDCGCLSFV